MGRYTSGSVGRDILAGAAGGIAAIWLANKLDHAIARAAGPEAARRTQAARPGGMDPAHALAKKAADAVGVELANPKDNPAGHTIHYGIAAGMGALYGLLRGIAPAVTTGRGALFGIALFVLKDEIGNPVIGTAPTPLETPARDHLRGAATHALFGIATDLVVRLVAPWRDVVVIEQGPPLAERIDQGRQYLRQTGGTLAEQGRQRLEQGRGYLAEGRGYLDQGLGYATQLANQARTRLPELAERGRTYANQAASEVQSRLPSYDDAASLAQTGRKRASRLAGDLRTRLPDIDPADIAASARNQANRLAGAARAHAPEIPTSGFSRAITRLFG